MNDGTGPARRPQRDSLVWLAPPVGIVVLLAAGAAWLAGAFTQSASSVSLAAGRPDAPAPATALVTRQDIAATTPETATLGYAGSYPVRGHGGGTLTWLPSPGQVIRQGQAVYRIGNGLPVVLLYGSVPDWRPLGAGATGADVAQLNHDLVALGDADGADIAACGWGCFSPATAAGVERLRSRLGFSAPGSLPLGQVVFEPEAIRVGQVTGTLGGAAAGTVLVATSDRRVVTIPLDPSDESRVRAGNRVTVALPDGATTPGVVSSAGTVAVSAPGPGGAAVTTIPVLVTLAHPSAAGTLDQAPVTVYLTTATARDVLVLPVTALLAQAAGGYAVEVAGRGSTRRLVPVTPGIFDDNSGLVQVTGALAPGQRVVVAPS